MTKNQSEAPRLSLKDWPKIRERLLRELRESTRLTGEDMATRITPFDLEARDD